jgi:hypothetical protein
MAMLVAMVQLGTACEFARLGLLGAFEPARRPEWTFKAHRVDGQRLVGWRPPLATVRSWWD